MSTKKVLVFENKSRIAQLEKDLIIATDKLNEFARMIAKIVSRELNDDELQELQHSGKNFALNELKKEFPFPKAEDEFNLNAMGLIGDFRQLERFEKTHGNQWRQFEFKANNGKFETEKVQPIIEAERFYADTKEKREILAFAQELVEVWNKAKKLNINAGFKSFMNAFEPLIYWTKPTGEDVQIKIDEQGLATVFRRLDREEKRREANKQMVGNGKK